MWPLKLSIGKQKKCKQNENQSFIYNEVTVLIKEIIDVDPGVSWQFGACFPICVTSTTEISCLLALELNIFNTCHTFGM